MAHVIHDIFTVVVLPNEIISFIVIIVIFFFFKARLAMISLLCLSKLLCLCHLHPHQFRIVIIVIFKSVLACIFCLFPNGSLHLIHHLLSFFGSFIKIMDMAFLLPERNFCIWTRLLLVLHLLPQQILRASRHINHGAKEEASHIPTRIPPFCCDPDELLVARICAIFANHSSPHKHICSYAYVFLLSSMYLRDQTTVEESGN